MQSYWSNLLLLNLEIIPLSARAGLIYVLREGDLELKWR